MTAQRNANRLAVTSSLAIATALLFGGAQAAKAQSFNASGTVVAGSASISTGSGTTDVFVGGTAVINWAPTDTATSAAPILFQNSGTTATFSSTADFTVLNRILPTDQTRAIQFDGTVLGRIGASAPSPGGTIYFYSPGGIIASSSAVFDVGNLGLTSLPVAFNATTGEFDAGDVVNFGTANAGSVVNLNTGANVTATGYVALVAPTVTHSGSINLNAPAGGAAAAALVAANAATITFSPDGLFDIQVTQGTGDVTGGINNSGSITGTAGAGLTASHRVYMVAIPQNQAIAIAIQGGSALGFDIAGAADVDGNAVILSAGHNVVAGEIDPTDLGVGRASVLMSATGGNIDFTSAVRARGTIVQIQSGTPSSPDSMSFAGDTVLTGRDQVSVTAAGGSIAFAGSVTGNTDTLLPQSSANPDGGGVAFNASSGGSLTVAGDLIADASGVRDRTGDGIVTGGSAQLGVNGTGSSVSISGNVAVIANASDALSGGFGTTGGQATISAGLGGILTIDGLASVSADALGGPGGNALGGAAIALAQSGGSLNFSDLTLSANGLGLITSVPGVDGFNGRGGLASLRANGSVSNITVTGTTLVEASGFGGSGNCPTCSDDGGSGTGGTAEVRGSGAAHSIDLGDVTVNAWGIGGNGNAAAAGGGLGGVASLSSEDATNLHSSGTISVNALGAGGTANNSAAAGTGQGGSATIQALTGGQVNSAGQLQTFAHGSGGMSIGGTGGLGRGGSASMTASSGSISVLAGVTLDSTGFGGDGLTGGNGTGGNSTLQTIGTGNFTVNEFDFGVEVISNGNAGAASVTGGTGGNSQGGTARIVANGGLINFTTLGLNVKAQAFQSNSRPAVDGTDGGNAIGGTANISQGGTGVISIFADPIIVSTTGTGSDNLGGGDRIAGSGRGGDSRITVNSAAGITLNGSVLIDADGIGGLGAATTGVSSGGSATGGVANLGAVNGVNTVNGPITVSAFASGGSAQLSGNGGAATGGQAIVGVIGGSTAGGINFGVTSGISTVSADAVGGDGRGAGTGANALGGTAQVFATGGNVATTGNLQISAIGNGGGSVDGLAGSGTGGFASFLADGRTNSVDADLVMTAIGLGGNASGLGNGGTATGGTAQLMSRNSGAANVLGNVTIDGFGRGGNSLAVGGNGGNATGGFAIIRVLSNGDVSIGAQTSVDAGAIGGSGDLNTGAGLGGNATGGTATIGAGNDDISDAGGGSISLGSFTQVNAKGIGGDAGQAGNGTGGGARVLAWNGTVTTATTSTLVINANGDGGFGNAGGDGGNGIGGTANLFAGNSLNGGSTITVDAAQVTATGNGGFGNLGLNPGDTGGNGGNGTGGTAVVTAAAGNGHLTASSVDIQVGGFGGGAGDGGNSGSGPGGIGGIGGNGSGGFINVGTESATATPGAAGTADFGSVNASAQGVGGAGGAGGSGTTQGNGGNGGDGTSGASVLLVRGSTVTITGTTNLFAGATGGNGGAGATDGIGGDATTGGNGGVGIIASNRFQVPSQRGTLVAGDIFASVPVQAGSGSVRGTATVASEPLSISLTNADATVGQLRFSAFDPNAIANGPPLVTGTPSTFLVTNGTLTANGGVSFATDGDVTLSIDNGTVNVPQIDISGRNWIAGPTPVTVGTLNSASTIDFTSAGDLVANVTISAATDLFFSAAGDVLFADIDAGGNLLIQNGGSTTLGNLSVIGNVDLLAAGSITTLGVDAGGYLNYESTGSVTTGALAAGQYIEIDSLGGGASVGNVDAGDYFTLQANGPVTVGNITAGIVNPSTDPLATYRVGVAGVGNVAVGTVNAAGDVGLLAQTGSVTSGALTGRDMLLFADTGVTVGGALNANGRVGIAKSAVAALGGAFDTFDKEPVFSALPFQVDQNTAATFGVGGPIAINGAVQTQSFRAYTTGNLTTSGPITAANGPLSMAAGGNIAVAGNLTGPFVVGIANGTMTVGDVTAPSLVGLFGLSGTTTGAISSGGAVLITSSGDVSTGAIASDPALFGLPANSNSKVQIFGRNLATGSVTSSQGISLVANQGMVTGPLQSQTDTLLLSGTGVTVNGAVSAQRIGIANVSQASLGGPVATFDPSLVFAGLPTGVTLPVSTGVAVAGPVAISGPVQSTSFRSLSTGAFSVGGNLTSGSGGIAIGADGGISVSGNLSSNAQAVLVSQGTTAIGNVTSPFAVIVVGQQGATTGNLSSTGTIQVFSAGNIATGSIVSNPVPTAPPSNIIVSAGGSATVSSISGRQTVAVAAGQDITVGSVNAARDVLLLPGQSLTAGGIFAGVNSIDPASGAPNGAIGRVLIGNNSMAQAGGNPTNPDFNAIFTATPVAAGGSVQINGSVYAGMFEAYNAGNFSANDITAFTRFHVESGGTATVRRRWFSPILDLWSGDIVIQGAPATNPNLAVGLNAGTTGEITLYATNANGAFIGDGLTAGNGYALSQAEFSLINSGTVFVTAKDQSANLIDMTVGNLTMTGPQAGSTIDDPNGQVLFATGTLSSGPNGGGTPSGGLRVSGNLTGTGFLSTNEVSFLADLFELDAGTGSIKITNASGGLSGLISIEATHIHMADSSILTKLEDDPLYVGHIADLNRPTSVSRPDGIFNALALDIFPGSTFYIQNTGTAATPAGFLAGPDVDVTPPDTPPTGGIEVVINGQFVTDSGTLTGKAAYDAVLAEQPDFTGFSTNSQLNACLFIGGCAVEEDPVGGISSEIEMISDSDLSDSPVVEDEPDEANSEEQSEEEKAAEEDVDGSPIAPPAPLIDTRPLNPPATITEPVAGSGNPALIGSVVNEGTAQEDQQ